MTPTTIAVIAFAAGVLVAWLLSRWQMQRTLRIERARAKRVADELKRLTLALDSAETGVFDVDIERNHLEWSPYHETLFGYRPGEFDGSADGFFSRIHPEDRDRVLEELRRARKGDLPYELIFRIQLRDGTVRWILAKGRFFRHDGEPYRVVGTVVDISDKKRLETELRFARDAAEAANRAKDVFLANISHEIRTPLGIVIGFADLISAGGFPLEKSRELASRIGKHGRHLLRLVDDVLDVSKIEVGKLVLVNEPVNVRELLLAVAAPLREQASDKGLSFNVDISPEVPRLITTDPTRVRQILDNLLTNALKFTRTGGIGLQASLRELSEGQRRLWIEVIDTGSGISPEFRSQLFQPFVQSEVKLNRKFGGTGLGLYLSAQLARRLGGDLELISTSPKGSTFALALPVIEPVVAPKPPLRALTPRPDQRPLRGTRILVVEDIRENREIIKYYLATAGADVAMAHDGREAVLKATEEAFDAILMDIQMPILDGNAATRELRRAGLETPILALTAHALEKERMASFAAGCDDYLTKPVSQEQLIDRILAYVGQRSAS